MDDTRGRAVRVALAGLAIHVVIVVLLLAAHHDPAWFVHFGSREPASPHARAALGDDVEVVGPFGHDGQVFWALAHDPLLVDAGRVRADLDRPVYRAQRDLYPLLASPWLVLGEGGLLWGLLGTNLLVVAAGGYLTARLAQRIGAPARAGLAFALNPLTLVATVMDFTDALALMFLVAVALAVRRDRWGWALVAAVAAVLAKESSFLGVAAIAVLVPGLPPHRRISLAVVPVAALAAWGLYVRWRFGWPATGIHELTAVPFGGFAGVLRDYYPDRSGVGDVLVACCLVPVAIAIVVRWWRRRTLETVTALPYALLVPFLAAPVLYLPLNAVRAIGPAITFVVVDLYVSPRLAAPAAAR